MNNPALTLALAMVFGMIAQITARHLRIPGIVLLLGTGRSQRGTTLLEEFTISNPVKINRLIADTEGIFFTFGFA